MRRKLSIRGLVVSMAIMGVFGVVTDLNGSRVKAAEVEYTWTLAALGQGGWIGGPLFEDGRVGGGGAFSAENGDIVARLVPTTWTEDDAEQITICFDVMQKKGPEGALPPTICIGPADVTGTPIHIMLFGSEHVFRITENH